MRIGIAIVALYAVAVLFLVTRANGPSKKRGGLTGRGGDFES